MARWLECGRCGVAPNSESGEGAIVGTASCRGATGQRPAGHSVLSQLAEGSPGPLLRLVGRAIAAPRRAWGLVSGAWLPV